jgi:hypothetical protein
MEPLPPCIRLWTSMVNGPRFTCSNCGPPSEDHGPERLARFHLRTPNHLKKVRQMEALHCKVCNLQCKYPSHYATHINSKAHKHRENPQPRPIVEYKCEICEVTFHSNNDRLRHLETRKHKMRANPPAENPCFCKVCTITCKYPYQYTAHLATAKHAKNVEKAQHADAAKEGISVPAVQS